MDNNSAKIIAFKAEEPIMGKLYELGADVFIEREFPDIKRAFTDKQILVVCMDEGTAHKDVNGENKFCLAGSGILFPAGSESERLEKVAGLLIERGVSDISSHGGCGAAGLAYHRDFPDAAKQENLAEKIEGHAKEWSDKLANKIRELSHPAERVHILAEDMERPVEFHNARVVYFDGVGGFNPSKEIGLPMGFVIERAHLPPDYAVEELKVAVSIAFGHHGFGEMFSATEPLVIIVFAKNDEEINNLKNEVASALAGDKNFIAGKVKVDGLVV